MAEDCLDEVNELADWLVTASFTDPDGNPVTPIAVYVRIDDLKSKTVIRNWQTFNPTSSELDIAIDSNENRIIKDRHAFEIRVVTVRWDYNSLPGIKHGASEYRYRLMNLYGAALGMSASQSPSHSESHSPSPSQSPSSSTSPSASASPST